MCRLRSLKALTCSTKRYLIALRMQLNTLCFSHVSFYFCYGTKRRFAENFKKSRAISRQLISIIVIMHSQCEFTFCYTWHIPQSDREQKRLRFIDFAVSNRTFGVSDGMTNRMPMDMSKRARNIIENISPGVLSVGLGHVCDLIRHGHSDR